MWQDADRVMSAGRTQRRLSGKIPTQEGRDWVKSGRSNSPTNTPDAASLLKAVFAVPLQEARMRAVKLPASGKRATACVYECLHAVEVINLS